MYSDKDINDIVSLVLNRVPRSRAIYLFGSYARGMARSDSDIDIAILTDEPLERAQKLETLGGLWHDAAAKGYSIDFILKPAQDFEDEKSLPTMSRVISQEGKILWQKI
jgi:predicted nucleotidyltransferase